jgi:hypothetical protein
MIRKVLIGLLGLVAVIQFVPYGSAENPPVAGEIPANAEVREVLRRACYDCHSNETVWPWYSHVAPAKWLVRYDVAEGRRHLNFSAWSEYPPRRQARKLEEIGEELAQGRMPPKLYTPLHPSSRLTEAEVALLRDWAAELASTIATEGAPADAAGPAAPAAPAGLTPVAGAAGGR